MYDLLVLNKSNINIAKLENFQIEINRFTNKEFS